MLSMRKLVSADSKNPIGDLYTCDQQILSLEGGRVALKQSCL